MHIGLCSANIGALRDQGRRQCHGQIPRQVQGVKRELPASRLLAWQTANQGSEQMSLLLQLALQRRERLLDLGERRFLRDDISFRNLAKTALLAQQIEHVAHDFDDALGCRDLAAQRCFLHGRKHDVGRQRDMRRLELVALVLGLRLERFDVAKVGAKHIGRVGHTHLTGKDIECARRVPGCIRRNLLPDRVEARIDAGKVEAALGSGVLACNAQCGLRRLQVWIVAQPLLDQRLERFRSEQ